MPSLKLAWGMRIEVINVCGANATGSSKRRTRFSMNSFTVRNKPTWDELEALVTKGRKSLRRMTPQELGRLDQLYRRTTTHLAQVATRSSDRRLHSYLNSLTAAAHSLIYLPPRKPVFSGLGFLLREGIARTFARNWKAHAISAGLFLFGAIIAYIAAYTDPLAAYALWPSDMAGERQPGSTPEQLLEALRSGRDQAGGEKFLFAAFLFANNLRVGVLAAAAGMLAGVPTVFLMIFNGMVLGVFVALHHRAGIYSEVWAWLLPHGVTEIGAIILCGGIGLMFGMAVLAPGDRSRTESLRAVGREAGIVALGAAIMLVAAAVIESYLRQSHLSTRARLIFAAGTALFWALFWWHGAYRERLARSTTTDSLLAGPSSS
ncbi:MAG: hypothetical protein C0483_17365 [Pirellula sp.]|nr:hypothetical protein [Pirellula sp.]